MTGSFGQDFRWPLVWHLRLWFYLIANDLLRNSAMGIGKTHLPCCPLREFFYVLLLLFVIFLFVSFTPYFSNFLHPYFSDILIPSTSFSPFLLTGDSCHLLTIPSLRNWKQLGISEKLKNTFSSPQKSAPQNALRYVES